MTNWKKKKQNTDSVSKSIIAINDGKANMEWRFDFLKYLDSITKIDDRKYFYELIPKIRFIANTDGIAWTTRNIDIFMNAPYKSSEISIPADNAKWEFIYYHECLHQLFDTFGVEAQIEKDKGFCDHEILNIASDLVINEHINKWYNIDYPSNKIVTPELLDKKYGVTYDRKTDDQYSMYEKIYNSWDKIKNDPLVRAQINSMLDIDITLDQGKTPGVEIKYNKIPTTPKWKAGSKAARIEVNEILGKIFNDYIAKNNGNTNGNTNEKTKISSIDAIDVLQKALEEVNKIRNKSSQFDKGTNTDIKEFFHTKVMNSSEFALFESENPTIDPNYVTFEQGWNNAIDDIQSEIKSRIEDIKKAAEQQKQPPQPKEKPDDKKEPNEPQQPPIRRVIDVPENDPTEPDLNLPDLTRKGGSNSKGSGKPKNDNKSIDIDNKTPQEAAGEAQQAADEAQQAANEAQQAANEAQQAARNSQQSSNNANNKSNKEQNNRGSQNSQNNSTDSNNKSSNDKSRQPQQSADTTRQAQQAADAARKAQQAADAAREAARKAQQAADAAREAANSGDEETAKAEAKNAIAESNKAKDKADEAKINKYKSNNNDGNDIEWTNPNSLKAQDEDDELKKAIQDWCDENIGEMSDDDAKYVIKKFAQNIDSRGALGEFVKKCQSSIKHSNGVVVETKMKKQNVSWSTKFSSIIKNTVKQKVNHKTNEWLRTFQKMNRRQGIINPGDIIKKGRLRKKDKLTISIAFYIDCSDSMGNDNVRSIFKFAYALDKYITKKYARNPIVDGCTFDFYQFTNGVVRIKPPLIPSSNGGTDDLDVLLGHIIRETKDHMINVVITDGEMHIDPPKIVTELNNLAGNVVFITKAAYLKSNLEQVKHLCASSQTIEERSQGNKFEYVLTSSLNISPDDFAKNF